MSYEYLRKVSRSCKKFSKQSLISAGMLELFLNQNCPEIHQLTLMVVTHTIHARGGGGGGEEEKKKRKKVGRSEKVGIPKKKSRKNGIPVSVWQSSEREYSQISHNLLSRCRGVNV